MLRGSTFKKLISCIMVITLVASLVSPASAAVAPDSVYDTYYFAIGDAVTEGVGLEDPYTESFYMQVAEQMGWEDDTNFYGKSELRIEELHYLLDSTYEGDGYTASLSTFLKRDRTKVQGFVKNAEVISINVGVRNFSTYIIDQMVHYLQNGGEQKYSFNWNAISDSLNNFTDVDVLDVTDQVRGIVLTELKAAAPDEGDLALDLIDYVVEVGVYATLSYIANFNAVIDVIHKLNPDARVYVVGIYNPAEDEVLTYDFNEDGVIGNYESIPVGDIFGALTEIANSYTQVLGNRVGEYTYVDPGTPELLIDQMADVSLPDADRIPTDLKLSMLELAKDTAVSMIQEMFEKFDIIKTDSEAFGLAEDIAALDTAEEREAYIKDYIYDMVVDKALDVFEEELQGYLGKFSEGNVLAREDVDKLLRDLDNAADDAARQVIIEEFVDNIIQDPDLQNQAAANVIYGYIEEYGLSGPVKVEDVVELLEDLGECTTDAQRTDITNKWVHNLAAAKIAEYVQQYVGAGNYTKQQAAAMLTAMEGKSDAEAKAIAKQRLRDDVFHAYIVTAFEKVYTDKGLTMPAGLTFDAFITNVENMEDNGQDYEAYIREVVRGSVSVYASDYVNNFLSASFFENLFAEMDEKDTDAAKKSYLSSKVSLGSDITNMLWSFYKDSYLYAVALATGKMNEYLDGVNTAADALSDYVDIKNAAVARILEVYAENYRDGRLDLTGFSDFKELRDSAISSVKDNYETYRDGIVKAMDACDVFNEKFDKVFAQLLTISEVDTISLNDLIAVGKKVMGSGTDYVAELATNLMQGDLENMEDTTVAYLALRYYFADGMMIMPSADGHAAIASQLVKAMRGQNAGSTAGNLANAVINNGLDLYHLAKSLAVTASGQMNTLINPEYYVALGDDIALGSAIGNADTYVKLLADALAMEYEDLGDFDADVIANLALSGMRTEELLALVDPSYNGDAYTADRFANIATLRNQYIAQIKDAELITIQIGVNNLVTFPVTQALLAFNGEETYELDWEHYFGEKWSNRVNRGKNALMDLLLGIVQHEDRCEKTLNTVFTTIESLAYS